MIKADYILHRNQERIKLVFGFDDALKAKVRSIVGSAWSQTNKAWLVPNNAETREQLKMLFPELVLPEVQKKEVDMVAVIDDVQCQDFVFNKTDYSLRNKIRILVNYRFIRVKCPKSEKDIQFFRSVKYCYWRAEGFYWEMPNSEDNFEMVNIYFGDRIDSFEEDETLPERKKNIITQVALNLKNKVIEAEGLKQIDDLIVSQVDGTQAL